MSEILEPAAETPRLMLACFDVKKNYPVRRGGKRRMLHALDGVNLHIYESETLGLVGESGCGKSTLGRAILNLNNPIEGSVVYWGKDISNLREGDMRPFRRELQMIFQDPYASLNPHMTISGAVKASLDAFHLGSEAERRQKTEELLEYVGLSRQQMEKYPHEMSGGQRQRVVIARALISDPSFIVCDEPVSALDVSVRSQVLNLMKKIQQERKLSYLFISHDLSVVRYLCDRVAVMYLGRIVELGSREDIFQRPLHPYTKALLSAIPIPDVDAARTERILLEGDLPSPVDPPAGCRFHTRCPYATAECGMAVPTMLRQSRTHSVACLRYGNAWLSEREAEVPK